MAQDKPGETLIEMAGEGKLTTESARQLIWYAASRVYDVLAALRARDDFDLTTLEDAGLLPLVKASEDEIRAFMDKRKGG